QVGVVRVLLLEIPKNLRLGQPVPQAFAGVVPEITEKPLLGLQSEGICDSAQDDEEAIAAIRCLRQHTGEVSGLPALHLADHQPTRAYLGIAWWVQQIDDLARHEVERADHLRCPTDPLQDIDISVPEPGVDVW